MISCVPSLIKCNFTFFQQFYLIFTILHTFYCFLPILFLRLRPILIFFIIIHMHFFGTWWTRCGWCEMRIVTQLTCLLGTNRNDFHRTSLKFFLKFEKLPYNNFPPDA